MLDGVKAYDSGVDRRPPTKQINLDLTGKTQLELVVTNGGDNISYDHGDWPAPASPAAAAAAANCHRL